MVPKAGGSLQYILYLNNQLMEEVVFLVEVSEEDGFTAKGLGVSIFTQADTLEDCTQQ